MWRGCGTVNVVYVTCPKCSFRLSYIYTSTVIRWLRNNVRNSLVVVPLRPVYEAEAMFPS